VPARVSTAASPEWSAYVGEENAAAYRQALERSVQGTEEAADPFLTYPFGVWEQRIMLALIEGEDYTALLASTQRKAQAYLACMAAVDRTGMTRQQVAEETIRCVQQADPEW
jgi:hypothetical protein